jgi:hypothetical protein
MARSAVVQAFVRLRTDSSQIKDDVEQGVEDATRSPILRKGVTVPVDADTKPAAGKMDELQVRVKKLTTFVSAIPISLDDKRAKADALALHASLLRLGRDTANPKISLEGALRAESQLLGVEAALDKINGKTASVNVKSAIPSRVGAGLSAPVGAAGLLAGGSGALALAGPLAGATLAMGAFGAVAIPTLTKVHAAQVKLTAAQQAYSLATTKAQRASALKAEQQATLGLTGAEKGLMQPLAQLSQMWGRLQTAVAPVLGYVVKFAVVILREAMPAIRTLALAGGKILTSFLASFDQLLASSTFRQFISVMVKFGTTASSVLAPQMTALLKVFMRLFIQTGPAGLQLLRALLPAIVALTNSLVPVITVLAKVLAVTVTWLAQRHLLIPFLGALALAFVVLAGSTGIGAVTIALTVLVAAAVWTVKNWGKVWGSIKHLAADAWKFIHDGWGKWLFPGLYLLVTTAIYVKNHWAAIWGAIKRIAQDFVNWIWHDFVQKIVTFFGRTLPSTFSQFRHSTAVIFDGVRHDIAHTWDQIWSNTIGRVQRGISDVIGWFKGLPGRAVGALFGLGHSLAAFAGKAIGEMWTGFKNVWSAVEHWFTGLPARILHALGIHSPPGWAIDAGKHIMSGLNIGLGHGLGKLTSFTTSIAAQVAAGLSGGLGGVTGAFTHSAGVAQSYARSLLSMYGWSQSQMNSLIPLWNHESGWNAYAVNASSGAYGIPQSLGHGHPYALGDYKNQIIWGLNYIRQRYGSPAAAEAHERAFNWYALGTASAAPGLAVVGERGPELVAFRGGEQVIPNIGASGRRYADGATTPAAPGQSGTGNGDVVRELRRLQNITAALGRDFADVLTRGARAAVHGT